MGHHHEGVAPVEGGRVPRRTARELESCIRPIRVVRDTAEAIGVAATRLMIFLSGVPHLQRKHACAAHDAALDRALEIDGIGQPRGSRSDANAMRPAGGQRRRVG